MHRAGWDGKPVSTFLHPALELPQSPDDAHPSARDSKADGEDAAVATVFTSLASAKAIVLAVSGGPDSVALMLMAAQWAKSGKAPPLFVATVDHGLRPDSRHEAETVALWAAALGLPHQLLVWDGDKPKTRIQERARDKRYALLCAYAAEVGADTLVTAHHADDQAETILFRLVRGSGLKGLAGMAFAMERGGLTHVRPLLDWTKDDLIGLCRDRQHPYFDDPSNRNPAYARARLRRLSGVLAENGLDRAALLRLGTRAAGPMLHCRPAPSLWQIVCRTAPSNRDLKPIFRTLRAEPEEIFSRGFWTSKSGLWPVKRLPCGSTGWNLAAAALHHALTKQDCFTATLGGTSLHLDLKSYLRIQPERSRRRGRTNA